MVATLRSSAILGACVLKAARGDDVYAYMADCTWPGYKFEPPISTPNAVDLVDSQAEDAAECQMRCTHHVGCAFWSFYHSSRCTLHHLDARPEWFNTTSPGMISGPALGPDAASYCGCNPHSAPTLPTLTDGAIFPGATALEAHAAWSNGRQPLGLGCWPKGVHDGPNAYQLYPCSQDVTLLSSTTNGWQGACLNLEEIPYPAGNTNDAWCEENCRAMPTCPSWQVPPRTNDDVLSGGCWYGVGDHCNYRAGNPNFHPEGAERLQHGQVQVLLNITGFKVLNLHNVFSNDFAESAEHSVADAIRECRYVCYSNINCQYWQYVQETGCWAEHPRNNGGVSRPLTDSGIEAAQGIHILAGEFILHWCAVAAPAPVATGSAAADGVTPPSPAPGSGPNMTLIVGLAACALIALVVAAACLFMRVNSSKRDKKTRAVKAPKTSRSKTPPPPPPPVEEPSMILPVPPLQVPTRSVILPQYSQIQPVATMHTTPAMAYTTSPAPAMAYTTSPGSVSIMQGGTLRTMAMRGP